MAGTFSLNTAGVTGLSQVLVALDDGTLFDYIAQKGGGSTVVVSAATKQTILRKVKVGANSALNEV